MIKKILFILIVLVFCQQAFAEEPRAAAEEGIFGGTFADALWTVLSFVILFLLLAKFAWKPILANLVSRENNIKHQIQVAQDTRQQAEKILDEHKHEALKIIKDATDQAMVRSQQLMEKAKQQTMELKRKSEEDISKARATFSEHIWQQCSQVVLGVSSKVLEKAVSKEDNERLIDEAITKLKQEYHQ